MPRDPWGGMLEPMLAGLVDLATLRRHARARAEDEDEGDLPDEEVAVRLAAADAPRQWTGGPYVLEVRDGWLTQVAGPAGLTLRLGERRIPLAPGVAVEVGEMPQVVEAIDARGRKVRLTR